MEAAPRLDRSADDDELGPALGGNTPDLLAEAPRPRAHDLVPHPDAVGGRHRGRDLEPLLQAHELPVEVRVDRQLALEHRRRDEDDPRSSVGGEPAGEVERVLRLLPVEQRNDDRAVPDGARPASKAPGAVVDQVDVRQPHRRSW
jgi:hypothetical protein